MDTRDVLTDAFDRIPEIIDSVLDGIDPEALTFRPDPEANTIAWLVWHLTRVQDHHVSELAGRRQVYVADGWAARLGLEADEADTGFGHTVDQVGAVTPPVAEMIGYLRAVSDNTREYLGTVDADELDRIVDRRWDPPVTAGVRLVSVIGDCLQHAGQAAYIRGVYERS